MRPSLFLGLAFTASSSWFISKYLNISADYFVWVVLFVLESVFIFRFAKVPLRGRAANALVIVFSILFSISLVIGEHLVVADAYSGLSDANYISECDIFDLVAFLFIVPGLYVLFAAPIAWARSGKQADGPVRPVVAWDQLDARWIAGLTLLILVLWLPYLIVYWPGYVFPDSLASVDQALGFASLNNHHPVAYTAFIYAGLKIASLLGLGHTAGIGFSTFAQMAFMAFAMAYLCRWVTVRCSFKPLFGVVLAILLGMCSYLASFSIALWKDPIFSAAGLLISLCLADLAWSDDSCASLRASWITLFIISGLAMSLLRNNGAFVLGLVAALLAVIVVKSFLLAGKQKARGYLVALISSIAVLFIYLVITGPVYSILGVQSSEAAEGAGIPLNQMARVAALGGSMTDSDKEYLGSIIPFDEYPSRYYPCCTDNLKWSEGFDNEALSKGMWSHWFSMLIKNPRLYFEAWVLQTFGFWTVNAEQAAGGWVRNIGAGVPQNIYQDGRVSLSQDYEINPGTLAVDETATSIFPIDSWSVPIGWLFWAASYLILLVILSGKAMWSLGIVPSMGVVFTLLLATPIWYLPRYGAVMQMCIPLYLAIAYVLFRSDCRRGI